MFIAYVHIHTDKQTTNNIKSNRYRKVCVGKRTGRPVSKYNSWTCNYLYIAPVYANITLSLCLQVSSLDWKNYKNPLRNPTIVYNIIPVPYLRV